MRALILVAGAALAVAACSSNESANNTMNVDENLTTTTDMNATDNTSTNNAM
jgi:predicted component of type VI protein secretion system